MKALVLGLAMFCCLFVLQIIVWRIKRPAGEYAVLLKMCCGVLIIATVGFAAVSWGRPESVRFVPQTPLEYLSLVFLYGGMSLAYIATYSAIQADSPSLSLLLMMERAGPQGVSLRDMEERFGDEVLVTPRLEDLVSGGLVKQVDSRYVIEQGGALLARVHLFYRGFLKLEKGG